MSYFIIYKTTNIKNDKFYIGMHKTDNLDDGYLGSGLKLKRSIRYHGKKNFKRKIIYFLDSREEMIQKEINIVNEELLKDPLCMNLKLGGEGGGKIWNKEHKEKLKTGARKWLKDKWKNDLVFRKNVMTSLISHVKKNHKKGIYNYNNFEGRQHTEETKRKISLTQQVKQKGEKNSQYGTSWITNEKENKKIYKEDIPNGWKLGRKIKK